MGFADHGLFLLSVGVVLLSAFVLMGAHGAAIPLLPLRVVMDRNRGGSFLASLLVGIASVRDVPVPHVLPARHVLDYSALKSGFAFLPFSAGIIFSATMASRCSHGSARGS